MSKISKTEYVALRKKGEKYMTLPIHDTILTEMLRTSGKELNSFLNQPLKKIQDWQLKRISYLVDYAFENIPLYRKKYSA